MSGQFILSSLERMADPAHPIPPQELLQELRDRAAALAPGLADSIRRAAIVALLIHYPRGGEAPTESQDRTWRASRATPFEPIAYNPSWQSLAFIDGSPRALASNAIDESAEREAMAIEDLCDMTGNPLPSDSRLQRADAIHAAIRLNVASAPPSRYNGAAARRAHERIVEAYKGDSAPLSVGRAYEPTTRADRARRATSKAHRRLQVLFAKLAKLAPGVDVSPLVSLLAS